MKIDLSAKLLDIRGGELLAEDGKPVSIGVALANHILQTEQAEPVKVIDWCRKLAKDEPLELDKTDAEKFRKMCEALKVSVLLKGQIVESLMDQMKAE